MVDEKNDGENQQVSAEQNKSHEKQMILAYFLNAKGIHPMDAIIVGAKMMGWGILIPKQNPDDEIMGLSMGTEKYFQFLDLENTGKIKEVEIVKPPQAGDENKPRE